MLFLLFTCQKTWIMNSEIVYYSHSPFLVHLTQRLTSAFANTWRPSSFVRSTKIMFKSDLFWNHWQFQPRSSLIVPSPFGDMPILFFHLVRIDVVSNTSRLCGIRAHTSVVIGTNYKCSCKSNYHTTTTGHKMLYNLFSTLYLIWNHLSHKHGKACYVVRTT